MNETPQYWIISVVIFLAGAFIGVFSAPYLPSNSNNTYQAGFNAAKTLVENSGAGNVFKIPDDIRVLSGIVTAVNGNRITFHLQSENPFDDPSLAERTTLVSASTTIIMQTQKDQKTLQAEFIAFTKASPSTKTGTSTSKLSLDAFLDVPGSIKDISVGNTITVIAPENIRVLKEFPVSEIRITPKLVAP